MNQSGPLWRTTALARLGHETFDVLVVGGGATGAGIARDAALRGLYVALCERGDFASQTSSQSSKLIHGGLRYLQYGNFDLVFEGLTERRRLIAAAPHLCRPLEFIFPAYRGTQPSLPVLGTGVFLYNLLALLRSPVASRRLPAHELYDLVPLRTAGLQGAQCYVDCQTNDARLVLETILDAQTAGAIVASYVHVRPPAHGPPGTGFRIAATDLHAGTPLSIRARAVINATGPFSDAFGDGRRALRPTLGVHLVFDAQRVPTGGRAIVIHSPRDGRLMFVLPAGQRTIVGTTDTDWQPKRGLQQIDAPPRPDDEIRARGADVDYILEAASHAFPAAALERGDVVSTFAGLRPLIATSASTTSATPREHEIWVDRHGVLTVAGGKLTTYRRMAEETVDRLCELLAARGMDRPLTPCSTRNRALPGHGDSHDLHSSHELAPDIRQHLAATYGARAASVMALAAAHETLTQRIIPGLPYLRAEILFAVRRDLACEVDDVLRRRIPVFRDAHDQGLSVAAETADIMAGELGWNSAQQGRSLDAYRATVASSRLWRGE